MEGPAYLLVLVCLYFLPTVIAVAKDRPNKGAIFALNLLLGWTFIGWLGAFIWSLTSGRAALPPIIIQPPPPPASRLAELPEPTKRCPACAELVHRDALKCKHCGELFATLQPIVPALPSAMAYCPGCGKLRGQGVTKCVYCGDTSHARDARPSS